MADKVPPLRGNLIPTSGIKPHRQGGTHGPGDRHPAAHSLNRRRPYRTPPAGRCRRLPRPDAAPQIRERFPRVRIRLRGDSHYACPEVMSWCEANGLEYIFGLSGNATLAARVQTLEARTGARYATRHAAEPPGFKLRRYTDFQGGAKSWNCQRRIGSKPDPMGSTPATSSPT